MNRTSLFRKGILMHRQKMRSTEIVQRRARELRGQMTLAETLLWEQLRDRKLQGFKFRRQAPIGHYIVDFCNPAYHLIVELDGSIHDFQQELDQERTKTLESKGYQILRFQNDAVEENIQTVLSAILTACRDPHL